MEHQAKNVEFLEYVPSVVMSDDVRAVLSRGGIYSLGRDQNMRPLIVINVKRMDFGKIEIELLKRCFVVLIEYVLERLMIPGQVENWNILLDLKDMGIFSIPVGVGLAE